LKRPISSNLLGKRRLNEHNSDKEEDIEQMKLKALQKKKSEAKKRTPAPKKRTKKQEQEQQGT
jgi:hypothetical protein